MGKVFFGVLVLFSLPVLALSPSVPAVDPFYESVIFINTEVHEQGESLPGICNATLISSRFAITAAHCVADSLLQGIKTTRVQVGLYHSITNKKTSKVYTNYKVTQDLQVQSRFFITKALEEKLKGGLYKTILPSEDVAIVEFQTPLKLQSQAFPHLTKTLSRQARFKAVTINYDENVSNTQAKREAVLDRVYSVPGVGVISTSTSRFAPADSGAPVFIEDQGERRLYGVIKGKRRIFGWDVISPVSDISCTIARENHKTIDQTLFCYRGFTTGTKYSGMDQPLSNISRAF